MVSQCVQPVNVRELGCGRFSAALPGSSEPGHVMVRLSATYSYIAGEKRLKQDSSTVLSRVLRWAGDADGDADESHQSPVTRCPFASRPSADRVESYRTKESYRGTLASPCPNECLRQQAVRVCPRQESTSQASLSGLMGEGVCPLIS